MLTREELAYMAGFFDGEGCIGAYAPRKYSIIVSIGQNDPTILIRLKKLYGGTLTGPDKGAHYKWQVSARKAEKFLRDILPWLVSKREQALIAIELADRPSYQRVAGGVPEEEKKYRASLGLRIKELKSYANRQAQA